MAHNTQAINFYSLSSEEKLAFAEKASRLLEANKIDEGIAMCKQIPLSPLMVRCFQYLYGDSFIAEQGYIVEDEPN